MRMSTSFDHLLTRSLTLDPGVKEDATASYWPGADYPDREVWLAKRCTPRPWRRASVYFNSSAHGTFNPGVNALKRKVRAEQDYFRIIARELGQPVFTIMREDGSPSLRRQLMTMRRKAQQQGHVTIEPDAKALRQKAMKEHLK